MPTKSDLAELLNQWWHLIAIAASAVFAFFGLKISVAKGLNDLSHLRTEFDGLRRDLHEAKKLRVDKDLTAAEATAEMRGELISLRKDMTKLQGDVQKLCWQLQDKEDKK